MSFDKKTITVPAGADVNVNFTNADSGVQNNFSVYKDDTAKEAIFQGDPVTGPDSTTYSFTAPGDAGTYYFRSDNHPAMNGQFIVK
jgi:plastocyanin